MKNIFRKEDDKDLNVQQSLYEVQTKRLKDLQAELNSGVLVEELQKNNSFKRSFLLAIIKGVGTAIGATVVAGIVLTLSVRVIQKSEKLPIIGDYVEQSQFLRDIQNSDE